MSTKLTKVTLRAGTKYQTLARDGSIRLTDFEVLDQDIEVRVGNLADGDAGEVYNVYETMDGRTLFVLTQNEAR